MFSVQHTIVFLHSDTLLYNINLICILVVVLNLHLRSTGQALIKNLTVLTWWSLVRVAVTEGSQKVINMVKRKILSYLSPLYIFIPPQERNFSFPKHKKECQKFGQLQHCCNFSLTWYHMNPCYHVFHSHEKMWMLPWESYFCLALDNEVTNLCPAKKQESGKAKKGLTPNYNPKTSRVSIVKYLFKV